MSIKAMKQALEALENLQGLCSEEGNFIEQLTIWTPEAMYALRTAIAEAEKPTATHITWNEAGDRVVNGVAEKQEPVAWRTFDGEGGYDYRTYDTNEDYADEWNERNPNHKGWVEPLYITPPAAQRKPLDAGEVSRIWKRHTDPDGPHHNPYDDDGLAFARAIEAAHGIGEKK
jgi:hypothetical protein